MASRKKDAKDRPPPPVTGRSFQKFVNETVLPGPYAQFKMRALDNARVEGVDEGLHGEALDAHVQLRMKQLPNHNISVRTARRWLKVRVWHSDAG